MSPSDREFLEGYLAHKFGLTQSLNPVSPYTEKMDYMVRTGNDRDLSIGTNQSANHFDGIIDEVRIYQRGLSPIEIKSIALNGTISFTTSASPLPPTVEILEIEPLANATVLIKGELTSKDENLPTVTVYYGRTDGGFDKNKWEQNQTINGGNPVSLGEFNGLITGLTSGENYFFRIFAESADGVDWSSGQPAVESDLLAYWRMDETNGSILNLSLIHI